MTEQHGNDPLEALFHDARTGQDPLPDDLFARIMADAAAIDTARHAPPPIGFWVGLGAMLGGWPSVAGLATAAVAGLWIGVAQPTGLSGFGVLGLGEGTTAYELGDLMPGFDALGSEG